MVIANRQVICTIITVNGGAGAGAEGDSSNLIKNLSYLK